MSWRSSGDERQTDGQTDRQTDRKGASVWCGTVWVNGMQRRHLPVSVVLVCVERWEAIAGEVRVRQRPVRVQTIRHRSCRPAMTHNTHTHMQHICRDGVPPAIDADAQHTVRPHSPRCSWVLSDFEFVRHLHNSFSRNSMPVSQPASHSAYLIARVSTPLALSVEVGKLRRAARPRRTGHTNSLVSEKMNKRNTQNSS